MTQRLPAPSPGDGINTETVQMCRVRAHEVLRQLDGTRPRIASIRWSWSIRSIRGLSHAGRSALDVLRSQCGTVAELTSADPAVVLGQFSATATVVALGLDPGVVFDAACAYRWRELKADPADTASDAGHDGSG
jgi:hypothetical protein